MALLLAASNNEFFKSNFGGFLETLLKVKDKAVRPFALEALRYLLTAYLAKKIEGQDEVIFFYLKRCIIFFYDY